MQFLGGLTAAAVPIADWRARAFLVYALAPGMASVLSS